MKDASCIFCKIAAGEVPAYKIYEDKEFLAFLDIFPNIEGQALLIPKKHMDSLFSNIGDKDLTAFMLATKKVANMMRKKLKVARVHAVLEGTGVNHLHIKLYPAAGLGAREWRQIIAEERIYFEEYPGYVTSLMGPKASDEVLKKLQKKLTS